jgi:alginate O-acetyltransferase complex protein AlgI
MLFNSLTYIFFLLGLVLLYWRLPQAVRLPVLLLASYVFYMVWNPPFGLIYGPFILLDSLYFYTLAWAMVRYPQFKKIILWTGLFSELGLLAYFKYLNFFALAASQIATLFGAKLPVFHYDVVLPLSISFTSFVLMAYLLDVYRGNEPPAKSPLKFCTYIAFFPHLIAGPVVRASELLHQFDACPTFSLDRLVQGVHRFCLGFFMKVFVADVFGRYVDAVYGNPSIYAFNTGWMSAYAFSIQIFCDFCGYTFMAQGSALMLGYTLPENFNAPLLARNVSDFWRRWHMSLSRWFRDYIYIGLGGNRHGVWETYRNIMLTMCLSGLWHGANWTFLLWGGLQGAALVAYKECQRWGLTRGLPVWVGMLLTYHVMVWIRVIFRAQSVHDAVLMWHAMLTWSDFKFVEQPPLVFNTHSIGLTSTSVLLMVIAFLGGHFLIDRYYAVVHRPEHDRLKTVFLGMGYFVFLYCILTMGGDRAASFVYFQF